MFINPKHAIEQGWITHPECKTLEDWMERDFLSPNAIDFSLDKLFTINKERPFILLEDNTKLHRGGLENTPFKNLPLPGLSDKFSENKDMFVLESGEVYDGMSNMTVDIPEGIACILIIRSTLNRNNLIMSNGLYDSGYQGALGFSIQSRGGDALIEPSARVGQVIFVSSENASMYKGGYNHADGTHWSTES